MPILPVGPSANPPPSATGRVASDSIKSAKTGATYSLNVFIPASYDADTAAYPVIYATDGDANFNPPGNRFENFKAILEKRGAKAILVGIGGTDRRGTDYVLPGVNAYHDFLTLELVPFIEAKYRADAKKRMLTGLSLGGLMTGIAFLLEAPDKLTFSYFLSFEGSFGYQKPDLDALEQKMFDASAGEQFPVTLLLARCNSGSDCNAVPVSDLYQKLSDRHYPGLALISTLFSSTSHTQTDIPAFEDAVARVLK
ncbi:alpha/beta hydrolase-fold protein [Variovorax sp. ZS18.2.2]|uniref:alpha/beta hydrolase n=1 Tax=Variovorax sp. ZS18.2.2 TaxID=2971255 RepID=UPI002150912F|nr:alpha/beta hydrolase-fold protein [Variovorax sp. ZS18.2.2]MCR6476297.1 alpha/beta hydrolase-fold protein [Variovorax sp. ZS18.2.2]